MECVLDGYQVVCHSNPKVPALEEFVRTVAQLPISSIGHILYLHYVGKCDVYCRTVDVEVSITSVAGCTYLYPIFGTRYVQVLCHVSLYLYLTHCTRRVRHGTCTRSTLYVGTLYWSTVQVPARTL